MFLFYELLLFYELELHVNIGYYHRESMKLIETELNRQYHTSNNMHKSEANITVENGIFKVALDHEEDFSEVFQ